MVNCFDNLQDILDCFSDEEKESYQERLAIMIHDGGLDEKTARIEALICVLRQKLFTSA